MYTYCSMDDWTSDYFDLDWCKAENGVFGSYEEAKRRADAIDGVVIEIS